MTTRKSTIFILLILFGNVAPATAQLSLAPTFVFVDSSEPVGSLIVTNGSASVQEVIINYEFGYPSVDSAGRRVIENDDLQAAEKHDMSAWIRAFPQRFRIEPGRRQVVRMLVQPTKALDDGIYWTRMVVTSTEATPGATQGTSRMSARLDLRLKQVIPIVFRKGSSETSVRVAGLRIEPQAQGADLRALIVRNGAVPFIGSVILNLFGEKGELIKEISTSTEVYYTSATHFRLTAEEVPPGRYEAELRLIPQRRDVPARLLPAMKPVAKRFSIELAAPLPAVADAE